MSNQFEKCIQSEDSDKCVESAKADVKRDIQMNSKKILIDKIIYLMNLNDSQIVEYQQIQNKYQRKVLKYCWSSQSNREQFIECMLKKNELFNIQQELFHHKLRFVLDQTNNQCLKSIKSKFDEQMCLQNARDQITIFQEQFEHTLQKELL
ncbi:unnamed protein product (macronuclear) [Paramecium tetraurelia]|uniref:Uncharacterized protein n=1 Tax=Paramecium tetraurelia TaxID=5888 RepID=A0CEM5_PARTE|nr:uncharacterized protein GSPATT00037681001 [Paramecium tetraurelia]CAK69242.1 unnamed protein product [Paramecium tetraurelia]|eukprot:XP_001436639.1 hypothetical protein (macronuclear) [Paramecium tetraurelia strain d4-2]